jgi:hypothetical protein
MIDPMDVIVHSTGTTITAYSPLSCTSVTTELVSCTTTITDTDLSYQILSIQATDMFGSTAVADATYFIDTPPGDLFID